MSVAKGTLDKRRLRAVELDHVAGIRERSGEHLVQLFSDGLGLVLLELDGVATHEIGRPQSHGHDRQDRAEWCVGLRIDLRAHHELDHG